MSVSRGVVSHGTQSVEFYCLVLVDETALDLRGGSERALQGPHSQTFTEMCAMKLQEKSKYKLDISRRLEVAQQRACRGPLRPNSHASNRVNDGSFENVGVTC